MKMNCCLRVLLILGVIFLFIATSCDYLTESPEETYTLSGVITKSGVDDSVMVYLKLVSKDGNFTDNALFSTRAIFNGGGTPYSIKKIKEGEYRLYALIDINRNAVGDETSVPDAGDFVTSTYVNIDDNKTLDFRDNAWSVYQP